MSTTFVGRGEASATRNEDSANRFARTLVSGRQARATTGMIDKRPRLIARCADVAEVIAAVNFGRAIADRQREIRLRLRHATVVMLAYAGRAAAYGFGVQADRPVSFGPGLMSLL